MTASGRTLSRLARVAARGQAGDTWLLPACERWSQHGWPDVKPRRVLRRLPLGLLWFLKRRLLSLLLQEGRFSPRFHLICRVLPGVFEPVRILSLWQLGHCGNDCFSSWVGGCCVPVDCCWWSGHIFCVRLRRLLGLGSFVPVDLCGWGSHCWCFDCDACWSWWSACSRYGAWRAWCAWRCLARLVCLACLACLVLCTFR